MSCSLDLMTHAIKRFFRPTPPAALVLLLVAVPTIAAAQSGPTNGAAPSPVPRPAQIEQGIQLDPNDLQLDLAPDPFSDDPLDITPSQDGLAGVDPLAGPEAGFQIVPPDRDAVGVPVQFVASLVENGRPINNDLAWTVYALSDQQVDDSDIVLTSQGGTLTNALPPGSYVVHVSYGMATLSRPVTVGPEGLQDTFALNAGGISLRGAIGANDFLPDDLVSFAVYPEAMNTDDRQQAVVRDVDERSILVVPAGRYTIVSSYGDVNAVVRAEIDVEPGQLTEAVMFHQAAQITLKLVNEPNGEALPNTAWSILNPGGDVVREFVGAFPTMVLSAGDYTIIARHDGQVFSREFTVVTGVNRDEELVAQ